nr:helix-turn-helix transcriptional regulator [Arthrobacter sp. E3]
MALKARKNQRKVVASLAPSNASDKAGAKQLLTKRELQVASLAASGMSDRDIAQQLTIAARTVEGHLYRAYTKLGISGRDDLADVL